MTEKDKFEDRLLTELRQVVHENPETLPASARRRPYGRFALAGAGVAAAVVAAGIYVGSGDNTTSAYAIDQQPDGAVAVEIKSLKDADGLQSGLRAAGVPAVVDYTPAAAAGCSLPAEAADGSAPKVTEATPGGPPLTTSSSGDGIVTAPAATLPADGSADSVPSAKALPATEAVPVPDGAPGPNSVTSSAEGTTFTIDPGDIPKGKKVFITTSTGGHPAYADGKATVLQAVAVSVGDEAPTTTPPC